MNNNKLALTDAELKKFLEEHFSYEVEMLYFSVTKLIEFKQINDSGGINMALETFLLHARNLREFFYYDTKKFPTDARASDFFEEGNLWREIRPDETDSILKIKERVGKELAHLTYKRIYGTPPEKNWSCGETFKDLLKTVKIFLNNLPDKYKGDGLQNIKKLVSGPTANS
jgi:hypothetical protein